MANPNTDRGSCSTRAVRLSDGVVLPVARLVGATFTEAGRGIGGWRGWATMRPGEGPDAVIARNRDTSFLDAFAAALSGAL